MRKLAGWMVAIALGARAIALHLPPAATFLLVTALLSGVIEEPRGRAAAGLLVCIALPLLVRWRLGEILHTRQRPLAVPDVLRTWTLQALPAVAQRLLMLTIVVFCDC
jgi:hypothetical protein